MKTRALIIGAGIGGLTAAVLLAHAGLDVTVCEAASGPGGKLRAVAVGGARIDAGPTVLTMLPVFQAIFADAGAQLENHLSVEKLDVLARHSWDDGARLDIHANPDRNMAAVKEFAGAKAADGYAAFATRAQKIFETLDGSFMRAPLPGLFRLIIDAGPGILNISPFAGLWDELGTYFAEPKLRQLFGRYATYCGASPFSAPATLMLIAHAEQLGVWTITGGMNRLATALAELAQAKGATFRYGAKIAEITARHGKVDGVVLADGTRIPAEAVISNADPAALAAGLFGPAAQQAMGRVMKGATRSFSAITWAMTGTAIGFPLAHHNVFFSNDYRAEFQEIAEGRLPTDPTVYVCAAAPGEFFCLVNAKADGVPNEAEEEKCLSRILEKLSRNGLTLQPAQTSRTGPREWANMYPATGGALYGRALQGWRDTFARPGSTTRLQGLYLAGGGVHPGPGLPIAALSGRLAATRLLRDLDSTGAYHPAAMPGGMWMRSAMTGTTRSP